MSRTRMWTLTEMRVALARHDIGTVFRIMQRHGFTQREIAALTGITQSEVSEVICRRRRIVAYGVLDRLVEGLRLPRGWAGLAFDDETTTLRERGGASTGAGVEVPADVDLARPAVAYGREAKGARRRVRGLLTI